MANLLKYPALNAKMKGMYAKTLQEEEIEELIRQNTLKEAISYLKTKFSSLENVNESSNRRILEQELNNVFIIDILKLYKYLDDKEISIFMHFILKYELNCVKNIFRNLTTNKDVKVTLKNIDNWTNKLFSNIKSINDVEEEKEFLEVIKNEEYYDIFKKYEDVIEEAPLEDIEVALDKFYFQEIFYLSKTINSEFEEMIGKEIDLLNIVWIYRAKKYFKHSPDEIKQILIPINYKISKNVIQKLIDSNDFEDMKAILSKTIYKQVFKDEEFIERDKTLYLHKMYLKYFKTKLFNICTIFCYMNLVDIEIKNIINIVEGIRYNIDRKEIQKKIIV